MTKESRKLLIIDDDRLTLQIFSDTLSEKNYCFDTAENGGDALKKVNSNTYDLIVCDVILPDISGIEVFKHAKKVSPSTDVVLITAHSDINSVLDALKFGASDYLKKPVSGNELVATIDRILERKKILDGYGAYKRYNELLQISQQISMSGDLNSLIHASMQSISNYLKASQAIFINYRKNLSNRYKILGKQNIPVRAATPVIENFLKKNSVDMPVAAIDIENDVICIPVFETGHHYFLLLLNCEALHTMRFSDAQNEIQLRTEIEFLQKQMTLSLKNIMKLNDARVLAVTDGLTGLRNQRYMEDYLENELKLAKKNKKPLSVLFIDIDRFKEINDNHGHLIGSKILCELADVMKRSVRDPEKDKIVRYGGDEYVIILSNLNSSGAYKVAERLRKRVEDYIFLKSDRRIHVTISIGICSYPETSFTKEEILTLADKALYEAKKISRNTVYTAKAHNL